MPLPLRHAALSLLVLLLVAGCVGEANPAPGACRAASASAEEARVVLGLVNAAREGAGLPRLAADATLGEAARAHACDLAARGDLTHRGSDGADLSQRLARVGLRPSLAAENIAAGQVSAEEVVADWMTSPGHRANILRPGLLTLGLGLAGSEIRYWVLILAGPPL